MSAIPPSQSDAASLIERISRGEVPREFVLVAAKGFLPLAQEELVAVLAFLSTSDDQEIVGHARDSLREIPPRVALGLARDTSTPPQVLDALTLAITDASVIESVLRNRATSDETIERLAASVGTTLQEVIVINQERILRRPSILEALLGNPSLNSDARRRAIELREEFFEKKRPAPVIDDGAGFDLTEEQQAELDSILASIVPEVAETVEEIVPPEGVVDDPTESTWRRIAQMTVAERVVLAFRGGLTERGILIRSRNRMICSAVIRSPRVNDMEAEVYAAMRNVEEEVLRVIGMNRQWMAKYSIMITLVKNPKAPIGVVLPLINRLTLKDLKSLSGDRNITDTVRQSARRLYNARKKE